MIFDRLTAAAAYVALHPLFAPSFAWLAAFDASTADGNYPIVGGACEARVMSYVTQPEAERRWESHRRFIDIQYVVSGRELMQHAHIASLNGATPYDSAQDVLFYDGAGGPVASLAVGSGDCAIFFPHDGHRPNIIAGAPEPVRKIVIKVPGER